VKMAGESLSESKGKKDEFYSQSPAKRIAIVAAGPVMSFALAFIIFYIVAVSIPTFSLKTKIGDLIEEYPAFSAGISAGDEIISIDNRRIIDWEQMRSIINKKAGEEINILVSRDERILAFWLTPKEEILENGQKVGVIGISPELVKSNPVTAMYMSSQMFSRNIYLIITGLSELIRGKIPAKEALGGPILIARITARLSEEGFIPVLNFAGMISVMLGLINLFPIPIADGGVIVLFLIEIFREKPVSEKAQLIYQNIGLAFVLGIMLFATYNDLTRDYSKILPRAEKALEQNSGE